MFIDDELNKALQNPKWNGLFLEPFRGRELSINKVQWLNIAFRLCIEGFALCKDGLHSFCSHYAILEVVV
jgi:hypothetical protein